MRILVPVDSSEFAFKALEKAMQMAKQLGAQLTIMSVAAQFEGVAEEVPISYASKLKDEAKKAVNRGKQLVEQAGLTCQTVVEVGASPADNIVRCAEESKTDLIVMGHRGMTGLARFLVGSVASRVVAHAPCSVQVVRLARIMHEPPAATADMAVLLGVLGSRTLRRTDMYTSGPSPCGCPVARPSPRSPDGVSCITRASRFTSCG